MTELKPQFRKLMSDESGQDLVEYALVAGCMGLACVATLKGVATAVATTFSNVNTTLTTAL